MIKMHLKSGAFFLALVLLHGCANNTAPPAPIFSDAIYSPAVTNEPFMFRGPPEGVR
ncbi:hypothetical protein AQULUS_06380 [Aquicella lusitana]|uniref:Lipoprotein n=1 Tax=Aquicella lusitana TaxID=254246 RepID=A0A370GXU2_9COXI|nr:hypothetical protein C8D86_10335 [Aquicella lusitana]VVC72914.1 hypothetical protein AQULUS_06380 [Aquicella lusitana]